MESNSSLQLQKRTLLPLGCLSCFTLRFQCVFCCRFTAERCGSVLYLPWSWDHHRRIGFLSNPATHWFRRNHAWTAQTSSSNTWHQTAVEPFYCHRSVGVVVQDIAIGTRGRGFNYWTGQIGHNVANPATFLRSCVAQALNREDGSRHSLHASAKCRERNEDFDMSQDKLCKVGPDGENRLCRWSQAVSVGSRFVYAAQPLESRLIVLEVDLQRVVEVLATSPLPYSLDYVTSNDQVTSSVWWRHKTSYDFNCLQLFVLCWMDWSREHSMLLVVHAAAVPGVHMAAQIQPLDGGRTIDLSVFTFFVSHETWGHGFVAHRRQQVAAFCTCM